MILQWLKDRSEAGRTAEDLYGRVVAMARRPEFYRDMGVADTPEGRFELVALHLSLALESLKQSNASGCEQLSRRTIETFVADMDDCMREMGVGDLMVPKKVKRAAAAFYQRAGAYRAALAQTGEPELEAALQRYVLHGQGVPRHAAALASHVRAQVHALAARPAEALYAGHQDGA